MPLIELVKQEQDIATLQKAIMTLGDIGDKRALGILEKIYAESKQPLVKQEAAIALNKIE
jgi:HEAT repeat protein